jgi:hypothetical protein
MNTDIFSNIEGEYSSPPVFGSGVTEQFHHLQDDWNALSGSNANIESTEIITTEVKCNDPKVLLEKYHSMKDKLKNIDDFQRSLQKELEDIKKYNKNFDQTIFDSLRIFGKNEDIISLSGKLSSAVKDGIELEVTRLTSLIEEGKIQKDKYIEEIRDYNKLLKECVMTLDEGERHNFENPYLCGICVERNITYVYRPCGHTICQTCVNTIHSWRCHICRTTVAEKIKVFFS